MADFSERLRDLRISKDVSQQELADYLSVNKQTISGYERGIRRPAGENAIETYEKLADFFNVDVSYLMGMSDLTTKISDPMDKTQEVLPEIYAKHYSALKDSGKQNIHMAIESEYEKEQERAERFKRALSLSKITTIEQARDILGDVAAYGGYASEKALINMANKVLQENNKKK